MSISREMYTVVRDGRSEQVRVTLAPMPGCDRTLIYRALQDAFAMGPPLLPAHLPYTRASVWWLFCN